MSTTMVGDETELKSVSIETDGSQKEIKKVGLINSFFKPVTKSKEDAKSKLGAEKTVNCNQDSDDGISNRIITEIFQKSNQSGLFDQKEKCSNKKTCDDNKQSSEEELPRKTKQTKPKWSVTCAVRNSSKCLSSSGSEFEDDGKSLFTTKTKEAQKSKRNKERTRPGSDISAQKSEGITSMESVGDEDKESKSIKKSRKSVKKVKTRTGSKCNSGTQESNENSTECMDVEEKERRSVIKDQTMESNKTSIKPGFDQEIELITDKYKPDNKSKASSSSEENKEVRTSAFDVLMKSQRVQKTEDHSAESSVLEASQTAVIPCDIVVDNSSSCEIADVKVKLPSEATVICQSKPPSLTGESSSDKIGNISSSGTNAFDFLMKKGRLSKSPCGVDSQVESELETEALETVEGPLKKKCKKKSFEFQLSIRASKKKDIEFSIESESVGSGGDNCQDEEKAEGKSKKKTRKHKKNSHSDSAEGKSDQSFVGEKCEEEEEGREVSRCKRGKKKSTVKSKVKTEEDSADVSLLEVNSEKEKRKSEKKRRKPGKKGVSNAEIVVMDVDPKEANDDKNFDPSIQNVRKKAKPQRSDEKNRVDIQEKNFKKKRKSKKSDKDSLAEQLPSIEGKQTEASNFKDMDEVVQTKMGKDQNEAESSHNTKIKAADTNEKADNKKEMETEFEHDKKNSVSSEPKTLAAIFLKRKPVPSKPDIDEENQTTTISSASSTSVTCPVNVSAGMTNEQSTIDKEHPQPKEKSAVEKEAANRAFKALFTGASSQKTAPSNSIADALPAPWPSVSHVFQKDGDASLDGNFWHLPWPIVKDHKFDVSLHSYLFLDGPLANLCHDTSALSTQDRIMFCGRRDLVQSLDNSYKLERKTVHPNFPEAVTKKLLSELALFYPGVPLRKLYKRYATKLQKYKASSVAVESKQVVPVKKMPVDDATSNLKLLESKKGEQEVETKSLPGRRRRGKRRLSSDGGVRQEQKIARKSGDLFTTVPSEDQGLSTDQSGNKSRKKRQREEDSDQPPEEACKGRRLSTRLQKKKAAVELEPVDDNLSQPETSSNRKKRKIADSKPDATEMHVLCKEEEKSPDVPDIANSEKTLSFVSDTMWTDLYRPVHSTEVMANASAVSKLRSWLEEWKIKREKTLRKELQQQRRLLAKQKGKSSSSQSSSHTLEWWDADSDSDFQMSDDDSDDSDTEGAGLSTAMFISGPTGVGKTAMVYACAEELGYKVFEVNSSSKRSGKHILSQLEEATQSHLVINNQPTTTSKGPVPESSFAGLFSKPVKNSPSASGPLGAFLQPTGSASQSKDKKGKKGSKGKNGKEKKEKTKVKGKSILKQPSQAASNDGTESNLSTKAASLILFEEVDVIFEEDKSFWMAVNSFLQNAKCPIVLISTESQVSCEGLYDQITLKQPSVNLLAAHLQLVGLMNNMFINPEDLKSLVAHNNCDIRKSLLNLQFWSASGGGVKIPYKRPASLKDKGTISDKSQTSQPMSICHTTNTACVTTDVLPSQEVQHLEPIITGGVLNDGGEESMFLSLSDWQVIKSGGLRRSSRSSHSGSLKPTEGDNSDSDFCEPKRKTLVCADGSTDSIFEITDTNDSQPVSSSDKRPDDSFQLPHMDSLLFESVHGLLNCVPEPNKGSLSVLRKEEKPGVTRQDNNPSEKLHLAHFSQVLGVNMTHTNLCDLMPLFVDLSSSQQKEKSELQAQESKSAPPVTTEDGKNKSENIFSDTSLFDDGTESCDNKMADERGLETGTCPEKELEECNTKNASSSQESTDTGFNESQVKEETGEGRQDQGHEIDKEAVVQKGSKLVHRKSSDEEKRTSKALEIFAQFAENMSFADAYCPNLSCTQSNSAQYGWWGAPLKPGLTDEHVTVQESRNWLACDTRASISGALEVANLESCFVKVKLLTEDLKDIGNSPLDENTEDHTSTGKSELCNFNILSEDLPAHDSNAVLRLDAVTQTQKSSVTSRRKLYSSLGSSIPVLNHCNHRSVVCDYIPTFRLLCHSERLREAAHIKRRFLHYLDSNSFPMSHSTMDALADSYLAH